MDRGVKPSPQNTIVSMNRLIHSAVPIPLLVALHKTVAIDVTVQSALEPLGSAFLGSMDVSKAVKAPRNAVRTNVSTGEIVQYHGSSKERTHGQTSSIDP